MAETLGNNGNQLAEIMHNNGLLQSGLTAEQCVRIARQNNIINTPQQQRWILNDDFWEDFLYRADELGYQMNV